MSFAILGSARCFLQQLCYLGSRGNLACVSHLLRLNPIAKPWAMSMKCCYGSTRIPPPRVRPYRRPQITFEENGTDDEEGINVEQQLQTRTATGMPLRSAQGSDQTNDVLRNWANETAEQYQIMSAQQWQDLKANLIGSGRVRDDGCFESRMMIACTIQRNFSLGRSLLHFIEASGDRPNLVVLSKYMRLCGQDRDGQVSESDILKVYDELVKYGPLYDGSTSEDIIHGLCATARWRDALNFLKMMSLTSRFQSPTALMAVVAAAFRNGDHELGWTMLKSAVDQQFLVPDDVMLTWINCCSKAQPGERISMAERMLFFLREHEVLISQRTAEQLKYFYESCLLTEDWQGTLTTVNGRGVCKSCNNALEDIRLTPAEFEELRSSFLSKVIEGRDVYQKTSPAELQRFQNFVHYTAPYSVVIDGLNVAYDMRGNKANSFQLARQLHDVVMHITRGQKRKMLILGRAHMKLWSKQFMDVIKKEAIIFFTDNISKDDPFMLFAALCSGQGTFFVSKDMMRDHKFCFASDAKLTSHFRKWQWSHQLQVLHVGYDGEVIIKPPVTHNPVTQMVNAHWHIPYEDRSGRQRNVIPNSWLCLRRRDVSLNFKSAQVKRAKKSLTSGQ